MFNVYIGYSYMRDYSDYSEAVFQLFVHVYKTAGTEVKCIIIGVLSACFRLLESMGKSIYASGYIKNTTTI